jgi:hypothetical protein
MIEPGSTWVLGYLAAVLAARGDAGALEEAMQLCGRARTAALGKDVDTRAHGRQRTATVFLRSGDAATAREKLDMAFAIFYKVGRYVFIIAASCLRSYVCHLYLLRVVACPWE